MFDLISAMMQEVVQIMKMRCAKSDSAMIAVFREQNQKWNALLKYNTMLKRNGFIEFVKYRLCEESFIPKKVIDKLTPM